MRKKKSYELKLSDALQNACPAPFKTVTVVKNKERLRIFRGSETKKTDA